MWLLSSYVTKEQGYTRDNVPNLVGQKLPNKDAADAAKKTFNAKLPQGNTPIPISGRMLTRPKMLRPCQQILLRQLKMSKPHKKIDSKYLDQLKEVMKSAKVDLGMYQGQLLFSDADLTRKRGLRVKLWISAY